jgi:hypothetical protein
MSARQLTFAAALALFPGLPAAAQGPLRLHEVVVPGAEYHVSCRVDLTGRLTLPPEGDQKGPAAVELRGHSAIEYDERVLDLAGRDRPARTVRVYRRVDLERTVGDKPQEAGIRPGVRRMVVLKHGQREVPFSPDGPLTWGEIDLVRTDVFTPALAGLLPDRAVAPGDRWPAARPAVEELTDLEQAEGSVECRFDEVTALGGRRLARVRLAGTVRGLSEDGPSRQLLAGYYYFDLESNHLSYLSLEGTHFLLDKDGQTTGTVKGQFVLTRQAHVRSPDLREEVLRGLTLEPTPENTLLLYDSPEQGVRFLYPRRWRVGLVRGRQVALDEAKGSGLLLTVELPKDVPTGAAYLAENRAFLAKQKAKVLRVDPPRPLTPDLEHHGLDVEMNGRRERLEYFTVRQPAGGATIAARLLPDDLSALRQDVERIARSVRVTGGMSLPRAVPADKK